MLMDDTFVVFGCCCMIPLMGDLDPILNLELPSRLYNL